MIKQINGKICSIGLPCFHRPPMFPNRLETVSRAMSYWWARSGMLGSVSHQHYNYRTISWGQSKSFPLLRIACRMPHAVYQVSFLALLDTSLGNKWNQRTKTPYTVTFFSQACCSVVSLLREWVTNIPLETLSVILMLRSHHWMPHLTYTREQQTN